MNLRVLFLFAAALSPAVMAIELAFPAYRNATYNQKLLLTWQDQLSGVAEVTSRRDIPIQDISDLLRNGQMSATLLQVPPTFFYAGIEQGWTPLLRLGKPSKLAAFAMSSDIKIKTVGTPSPQTVAAKVAPVLTNAPITSFADHENCLRAAASQQVDACVTTQRFAEGYATRYGIELVPASEVLTAPPALIFASSRISESMLDILRNTPIQLGEHEFIAFDPAQDSLLYESLR